MLRRLVRRLLPAAAGPSTAPPPSQPPPRALPVSGGVGPVRISLVDLPGLLAGIQPRGRPILVHHWASWDEPSTAGLPAMVALAARHAAHLDVVSVAWDELTAAPMGRIAGMAQRPAKWAGGEQAEAWARQAGLSWPVLVCEADPDDTFFAALGLADRWVPQVTLVGADGTVVAHHGGPMAGAGWAAFEAAVATTSARAASGTT
ncbi:MAG: hypothetical protein V4850_06270 [Myxococcota bacterium]